ncbi:MAG: hypothetical protein DRN18_01815 [Thermoplasmata archaeon]|nr:MAG: hypothetical protein DRN18_01815 [Thermoplasmata archaeon]
MIKKVLMVSAIVFSIIVLVLISAVASATSFTLNSWEVRDDDGYPSIYLNFDVTDDVELRLLDPEGLKIDYVYIDKYQHGIYLHMADFHEIPNPGTYQLLVLRYSYPEDEVIYSKTFSFGGANFSIKNIDLDWEYVDDHYETNYIFVDCQNSGDLPAYISKLTIRIGDFKKWIDELDEYLEPLWMPGDGVGYSWGYSFTKNSDPEKMLTVPDAGDYYVEVTIRDADGHIVSTLERTITVGGVEEPHNESNHNVTNDNDVTDTSVNEESKTPGFEITLALVAILTVGIISMKRKNAN